MIFLKCFTIAELLHNPGGHNARLLKEVKQCGTNLVVARIFPVHISDFLNGVDYK